MSQYKTKNSPKSSLWRLALRLCGIHLASALITFLAFFGAYEIFKNHVASWAFTAISSFLGCLYFICMAYRMPELLGKKDYNYVKYNRISEFPLKGLYAGLLAEVPFVLLFIASVLRASEGLTLAIMFANLNFGWMYSLMGNVWGLIPSAITITLAWAGYRNGYRRIDIFGKIIYKKRKD
ncbi:MAG: hypothetical protein FWH04_03775 [Oscillospiraceae bacterium]|nr:hypothetical protein [Oscillospiraceae bacterium]